MYVVQTIINILLFPKMIGYNNNINNDYWSHKLYIYTASTHVLLTLSTAVCAHQVSRHWSNRRSYGYSRRIICYTLKIKITYERNSVTK